jgi:ketosteroid isomerase-like protein
MYATIVKRIIRRGFEDLSRGDFEATLRRFDPEARLLFSGEHELGGEQHGVAAIRAWFIRLFALFPGIHWEIRRVLVDGWPWDTWISTRFVVRAQVNGEPYENEGVQLVRLRWGRVIEDDIWEDTAKLVAALTVLARSGAGHQLVRRWHD